MTRHVIDHRQPRPRRHGPNYRFQNLLRLPHRKRHIGHHHFRSCPSSRLHQHIPASIIIVAGRQQLGTGPKVQRPYHRIYGSRRIRHEHQVLSGRPDKLRQRLSRAIQRLLETSPEKFYRLRFHLSPELGLHCQDGFRTCSKRTMIQKHRLRRQSPIFSKRRWFWKC
jgi:hypothetical protein